MLDYLKKSLSESLRKASIEVDRIKAVQKSIKHPRFKYAVYDSETGVIEYKWKPIKQWFNKKRIVHVKIVPIVTKGAPEYATISSDNGKQRR